MYKNNNSHYELIFIRKFFVLVSLLFEFQIQHIKDLFNLKLIFVIKKIMIVSRRETIKLF